MIASFRLTKRFVISSRDPNPASAPHWQRGVMEARSADRLPTGKMWVYEPKWDGFRCLLARLGEIEYGLCSMHCRKEREAWENPLQCEA